MNETVMINDLRKGDKIRLNDGREAMIRDNAKGLTRTIETPVIGMQGSMDIGSCYAYQFAMVYRNGEWLLVTMTLAQAKQAKQIQAFMGKW